MTRSGSSGVRAPAPAKKARGKIPTVTAHAGSLGTRANTKESFLAALALPVDYLEADVRFTRAGGTYLSHDPLPPARQRDAMRLEELLAMVARRPGVRLNLDMKEVTGIEEMSRVVKRAGMASRVVLTGLSGDGLRAAREQGGGLRFLYNHAPGFLQRRTARGAAALARSIRESGARGLNAHHLLVTRRIARAMADAGLALSVWTVDGEREMRRILRLGADNITTRRVDVLLGLREREAAMNLRGYFHAMGPKRLLEAILLSVFLLFFYGPLMNTLMIAFADRYMYAESRAFLPPAFSLKWWQFVLSQKNLVSAISLSFIVAAVVTVGSLLICLPAAYAFARINFPLKPLFQFSFLFANAFPRMGLYVSIAIIFFKLNLMGTFLGVILIHLLGTLMYMTWIPAGAFRSVHAHQEEAARDVGATPFQTFRHITLPLAAPGHHGREHLHLPGSRWRKRRGPCWSASPTSRPSPWSCTGSSTTTRRPRAPSSPSSSCCRPSSSSPCSVNSPARMPSRPASR